MKKFLILLLLSCATVMAARADYELLVAAQNGDLTTIKTIFSTPITKGKEQPDCRTIDVATRLAFEYDQSDEVVAFLLAKNTCKGSTLAWACGNGNMRAVEMILKNDPSTTINTTFVGHNHIFMAKAYAHESEMHTHIVNLLKQHLVARGYEYAGTL